MPGAILNAPGFCGKLPAEGDFVVRGLPATFVRPWDRWISRHLARRLTRGGTVCFLLPTEPAGAFTGVVLASTDRAGRHFPLTLAAPVAFPRRDLPVTAATWYDALTAAGALATAGDLDVTALSARLAGLRPPPATPGETADRLLLWVPERAPVDTDPEAPGPALDALLGTPAEAR